MDESLVIVEELEQGIAIVRLNREQAANALSRALLEELTGALETLSHNQSLRVVILTGTGEKAFCAGADLKERKGMNEVQVREAVGRIRRAVETVAKVPVPVIAAINGVAFGGGTELALAADIRVLSSQAKMGLTETSLAIVPGAGGTQRLARLIGVSKAKELIFTARRVDAQTALHLGLADYVVDQAEVLATALQLAREIAVNGPLAVRQAKLAIDAGMNVDLQTGLRIEEWAYETIIPTRDRLEGLQAFAEKRKPVYEGR